MNYRFFSFEWFPFLNAVIVHARISWSIHLRWLAVSCYFIASFVTRYALDINIPLQSISLLLGLLALINFVYYLVYKRVKSLSLAGELVFIFIHIMVDLIFLTLILHYSGGIENPIFLFYMFHVVISSIIFPGMLPLFVTAFVTISFSGLIFLEYNGIIEHYSVFSTGIHENLVFIYVTLTVFVITAFVSNYICTTFMKIYRDIKRQVDEQHRKLIEVDEHKTRFFMTTSHELKSPIIAIKSIVDGVVQNFGQQLDQRGLDLLRRASTRSDQMLHILKELLDLSRNRMTFLPKAGIKTDIIQVLDEVIAQERTHADSHRIQIVRDYANKAVVIDADPEDIKKVFDNLLGNALRYTADDGSIAIRVELQEKNVNISFTDSGIGIPQGEIDKIFEEFYRAENAKKLISFGTGLGLSLSRQIVKNYGGDMRVESEMGKGSVFNISLPVGGQGGAK